MIVFSRRLAFGRPRSHAISDKLEQWPAGPYTLHRERLQAQRTKTPVRNSQNRGFGPAQVGAQVEALLFLRKLGGSFERP
jgi:hypothetical protein